MMRTLLILGAVLTMFLLAGCQQKTTEVPANPEAIKNKFPAAPKTK